MNMVITSNKSSNYPISNNNPHKSPDQKSSKTLLRDKDCYVLSAISFFSHLCLSVYVYLMCKKCIICRNKYET